MLLPQNMTARNSTHGVMLRLQPPSLWHVEKCLMGVSGLISQVYMTCWVLISVIELHVQQCAKVRHYQPPKTLERTYALNQGVIVVYGTFVVVSGSICENGENGTSYEAVRVK